MTAIEVKLPELGDGIKSGDILDVLVREGDSITKDQTICEIETDKATVEIPSSHSGKVVKIHIQSGQSIPIGATLVTLEATSGAVPAAPAAAPTPATPPPAPPTPAVAERPAPAPVAPTPAAPAAPPAPTAARPVAPAVAEPQPVVAAPAAAISALSVTPAGPAIRRLAREVGIDLSHVAGTGPGGRITREDVLAAVRRSSAGTVSTPTTPPPAVRAPSNAAVDASPEIAPAAPLTTGATNDEWGPIQIDRMTKIRKTIVTRMHDSWSTVPRVTNFDDADITELERIRQASKPDYESRGIKLTTMPFLIKAVALALKSNPAINAAIDDLQEQIIYKQYVNIGIAVDTPRGLVVPVLRRPDQLSIPDVARSLATIAENARNNDFKIEDLRGGTFSISNLGAVGGTYSTPIVNIPEVAILLVGRARKMPVVVNEQTDQVAVRLMMPLSLSYDHRLVDGATAARFLNEVIAYLENPSRLLIAP